MFVFLSKHISNIRKQLQFSWWLLALVVEHMDGSYMDTRELSILDYDIANNRALCPEEKVIPGREGDRIDRRVLPFHSITRFLHGVRP